jgi:electron transfer flavoprotein alpha subunit
MPNIAVFIEQRDGEVKKVAWQMLSEARRLVDAAGGEVWGVHLHAAACNTAAAAGKYGAHKLFVAMDEHFKLYNSEAYALALKSFVEAHKPDFLLMGATAMGKDLAPKLAAKLQCASISDSVGLKLDGGLEVRRPIFAGKCYVDVRPKDGFAIVGIRPNAFTLKEAGGPAAEESFDPGLAGLAPKAVVREILKGEGKKVDLTEAEIVVSGGRGIKGSENYHLIEALADALSAAPGASRAIVDAGWVDYPHQVGQTGKTVSPNLYIACGISGAIQHLAGMSSSKCIVAINKDASAPIFKVADYGIVGDLFKILPPLTEAIQELRK